MAKGREISVRRERWGNALAKPDWGEKHLCASCDARFYDMKRTPVSCPACGAKPKVSTSISADKGTQARPKPNATDTTTADTEDPKVDDGTDEDILDDTAEIEEEEENVAEVLEVDVAQKDQP